MDANLHINNVSNVNTQTDISLLEDKLLTTLENV